MITATRYGPPETWVRQLFSSKQALCGGVIRRAAKDVDREMGRAALEREVRRRGWHMIETGGQVVIICSDDRLRVIC